MHNLDLLLGGEVISSAQSCYILRARGKATESLKTCCVYVLGRTHTIIHDV